MCGYHEDEHEASRTNRIQRWKEEGKCLCGRTPLPGLRVCEKCRARNQRYYLRHKEEINKQARLKHQQNKAENNRRCRLRYRRQKELREAGMEKEKLMGELMQRASAVVEAYRQLEVKKTGPSRMALKSQVDQLEEIVNRIAAVEVKA